MRLRSTLGATVLLVALSPASVGGNEVATCLRSNPDSCGAGRLDINFGGKLTPRQLPRREFVPIGMTARGAIQTQNGGHFPALREATVSVDNGIRINARGLAVCARPRLESLDAAGARRACRTAVVGHGVARAGITSGAEVRVPLTLFNGGTSAGVTRLFVHSSAVATDGALLAVAQIRRRGNELKATWRIPRILEGDGHLLGFQFQIKRRFAASGGQHSYLLGRCPNGVLRVGFSKLVFVNETHLPGVASRTFLKSGLAVPCVPQR